jgi:hypothetical protein
MADRKPPPLRLNPDHTIQNPTWTVTRRQRMEVSPKRTPNIPAEVIDPEQYQQRTITSTERIQIVQIPIEVTDDNPADLYLSLSPTATTNQQVESTTTTIEAGGIPVIGAVTKDSVPIFNGIYQNSQHRQTTTIITTTTTTYVMLDDSSQTSDEYERLSDDEPTQLTIDMPMLASDTDKDSEDEYVIINKTETEPKIDKTEIQIVDSHPHLLSYQNEEQRLDSRAETYITSPRSSSQSPNFELTSEDERNTPTPILQTPHGFGDYEIIDRDVSQRKDQHLGKPSSGSKINEFFKKGAAHQDYPTTEIYEGPIASTSRATDVDGTPLETHVSVYHSGRSDIPAATPAHIEREQKPAETEDFGYKAAKLGSKITGFFKKGAAHQDYPTTEIYEGPMASTSRATDVDGTPLETHVSVYHSGRSDIPITTTAHIEREQKPAETEDYETVLAPQDSSFGVTSEMFTCNRYTTSGDMSERQNYEESFLPSHDSLPRFDVKISAFPQKEFSKASDNAGYYRCDNDNTYSDRSSYGESRNYEDYLVAPSRRRGWTTVTETTTITYSRRVSVERVVRGRKQRYFENVEVHEYGKPFYASYAPSSYSRYGSTRSHSQGPAARNDKWQQTDNWDTNYLAKPVYGSHRSHSATRTNERNYRSYSSKLYDRELHVNQQTPEYYIPPVDYPLSARDVSVKRPDYQSAVYENDLLTFSETDGKEFKPARQHEVKLQFLNSNLEEIPVTQLLDDFPTIEQDESHGNISSNVVPLETRLLQPGVHTRNRPNAPLRRAQHRIRNYCVML